MPRARTKKRELRQSSTSAHSLVRTRPKNNNNNNNNNKSTSRKRTSPHKLAEKLKQVREMLGLSQGDIAAKLGIKDRASVSGYERGEREPPLPTLLAYARLGKVTVERLIDDELDLP